MTLERKPQLGPMVMMVRHKVVEGSRRPAAQTTRLEMLAWTGFVAGREGQASSAIDVRDPRVRPIGEVQVSASCCCCCWNLGLNLAPHRLGLLVGDSDWDTRHARPKYREVHEFVEESLAVA